jgi:hypothetical protein
MFERGGDLAAWADFLIVPLSNAGTDLPANRHNHWHDITLKILQKVHAVSYFL